MRHAERLVPTITVLAGLLLCNSPALAQTDFNPITPSQLVECTHVDRALGRIPRGDGINGVTDDEIGPGGWRFNRDGESFVTFEYAWDGSQYDVVAGRSGTFGNAAIINDYPALLDLPQLPAPGPLVFRDHQGEIVLTGDTSSVLPAFKLPGKGAGKVRIPMTETDTNVFEGCAMSPLLKNLGFIVTEGGDFVQKEYFKAYAKTDADGLVLFFETTEVSTVKNVRPGEN